MVGQMQRWKAITVKRGKRYTDFNEFKIQITGDLGGDNNDYEYHE